MAGGRSKHGPSYTPAHKSSYVHPSLRAAPSTPSTSSGPVTPDAEQPTTVNERIAHLRRTQPSTDETIRKLRQLAMQNAARGRHIRRPLDPFVAGPAAPQSWLVSSSRPHPRARERNLGDARMPDRPDYMPHVELPDVVSLEHQSLKALATDMSDHVRFNHKFLSLLPVDVKALLLSYVACYGYDPGITIEGLQALFNTSYETELPLTSGTQGLKHLDLGRAIGNSLRLRQLDKYWHTEGIRPSDVSKASEKPSGEQEADVPESWDEVADGRRPPPIARSMGSFNRFPHLTHLSLAFPSPNVSWADLITTARHFGSITHLSLAGWPMPRLLSADGRNTPGQATTTDADEVADAAYVLRQFGRRTPKLKYLDLDRCQGWWDALRFRFPSAPHWSMVDRRRRVGWDLDALSDDFLNDPNPISAASSDSSSEDAKVRRRDAQRATTIFAHWRDLETLSLNQLIPIPFLVGEHQLKQLHGLRGATFRASSWNGIDIHSEHSLQESYYFRSDDPEVMASVTERKFARQWIKDEKMKILVMTFVKEMGMEHMVMPWGWDEKDIHERFGKGGSRSVDPNIDRDWTRWT